MEFMEFAKAHGILIDRTPPIGVWQRYATVDHPRKKNGAVKFMGDHAFIQNWAENSEVSVWKGDSVAPQQFQRMVSDASRQRQELQESAAKKASWILSQCRLGSHPYLDRKGFEDEEGNVWRTEEGSTLVVPMRVGSHLVGCQLIKEDGTKRFLYGQRTSNAQFIIDNRGMNILCEGYATALSIRKSLKHLKVPYKLHVCFSAGNMQKVAASLGSGVVVADNDESGTGERVAREIGWKYFLPPVVGQDFNDYQMDVGVFKSGMAIRKLLNQG